VTRIALAFLVGVIIGAVAVALAFALRPERSWQEQEARSTAGSLACNLAPGLTNRCLPISKFERTATYTWDVRIEQGNRSFCYRLRPPLPPARQPCA
jgi:hypothetical protein